MKIYESGISARKKCLGQKAKFKTYVCVLDEVYGLTLNQAFDVMVAELGSQLSFPLIKKDFTSLTVTIEDGTQYQLAHEIVLTKTGVETVPSNLLRYIFSRLFTIDALYIDEDDQFVDLTQKAANHIHNGYLDTSIKKTIFEYQPELLVEVFRFKKQYEGKEHNGDNLCGELANILCEFTPKRLLNNFEPLTQLIEKHGSRLVDEMCSYDSVKRYLTQTCGMKTRVTFEPPPFKELSISTNSCKDLKIENDALPGFL